MNNDDQVDTDTPVPVHIVEVLGACGSWGVQRLLLFLALQEGLWKLILPVITLGPLTQELLLFVSRGVFAHHKCIM
jgi:hypothetical protein